MTTKDMEAIESGDWFLFIVGEIAYKDIYGDRHVTRFCLGYDRATKKFIPGDFGNDMD